MLLQTASSKKEKGVYCYMLCCKSFLFPTFSTKILSKIENYSTEAEALEDLESDEEEVIEVEHKKMPSIKRVASLRRSAQLRRSTISQNLSDSWSQKEEVRFGIAKLKLTSYIIVL